MTELDLEAVKARHEQTIRSGWLGCDLQKAHEDRAALISEVEALLSALKQIDFDAQNALDAAPGLGAAYWIIGLNGIRDRVRAVLPETETEEK